MKLSPQGEQFIIAREGCKLTAYQDGGGVWTIGVGHTETAYPQMTITEDQAIELLRADIRKYENAANTMIRVKITQPQFDALISLMFNIGIAAFKSSSLLRLLNDGQMRAVPDQFLRWKFISGQVSKGLLNRRKAERELFMNGVYQ